MYLLQAERILLQRAALRISMYRRDEAMTQQQEGTGFSRVAGKSGDKIRHLSMLWFGPGMVIAECCFVHSTSLNLSNCMNGALVEAL